ncbi:metal-dependent hydrolase family protein [Agaribacter marinus]|uniref:Xaa-Pro dipeptidase n=1 Tax=Agaribacter marinus TaxID=1431249 RepID=A0AA37WJZ9_9ALTE|nr:amidohydrolase family protein [Agaribacter marinus]GLR70430.1 Xaa-Pro dipeptidase [Agaribacter marinus]
MKTKTSYLKRTLTTLLIIATTYTIAASASAETTQVYADAMLDVNSGKLLKRPLITIKDGIITNIDTKQSSVPEGTIDLSGHTIMPGLMDMHVHLTSDAEQHGYKRLASSLPRVTLTGVKHAKRTLMAGFTTVRNVGAPGFADVALRDAIADGDILGPRMFVAGRSIGVTGGHCDNNLLPHLYKVKSGGVADGPWAMREKVRENIKYGANVIKFCATGGVLSKGTKVGVQQLAFEEMQALIEEAHMRGLTVAAHAHGTEGILTAIKAGVDSIEHASFLNDEAIKLAKKMGTYFSMDVYVTEYILGEGEKAGILEESLAKERTVGKKQRDNFRKAVKAGVNMVFGSDAGVYPHGDNPKQFSRMVKFGMTPLQAIQAATINPAKLLKQSKSLGSIEVGKMADIVAVKGNPLDNIEILEDVKFVMKQGAVFKAL